MRFRNIKHNSAKNNNKHEKKTKAKYAKAPDRIKAFITDLFMIYMPILYITTYLFMDGKDDFLSSDIAPLLAVSIYGIIYTIFVNKRGQTPGKKAYEIKIVDARTGENLSITKSFCRFVMFLVTSFSLIGLLLPFYRKDNKTLHDLICGSVVIVASKGLES